MRGLAALALLAAASAALAQAQEEGGQMHELIGQMGGRAATLQIYETSRPDGSARLTGEYWILTPLHQRFLEGERSKQLGVTFLKEGNSPILYGRPGTATLQGMWSAGVLRGTRFAPGGQERERFEFQEKFPDMQGYSVEARCELAQGRYAATLELAVEQGRLRRLDWRSRVAPSGHVCAVVTEEQQPFDGGLRFATGRCRVTLRDLGEFVRVSAENCTEACGSQAYLEPVLLDRRGGCQLMRPLQR
ncbi:MAG: hypothetical protein OEV81_00010 [Betaproteobacteria bacterium]|nr:hypothetical protein [Betaproteobacteria bacterium]MDH5220074.1 hypothetical protein [Betaproteobacteria bacterium]MDH5349344.1 hypothetical protein [Betaproteobacteria bacterium]